MKKSKSRFSLLVVLFVCLCSIAIGHGTAVAVDRGGTLKLAVDLEPSSLDPIFGNAPGRDRMFFNTFAENLIYQDDTGKFLPMLAESWEYSSDNKEILFKLRSGIVFHDDTVFDADAVKFNLDRNRDPNLSKRSSKELESIESVEVIDEKTVRVKLSKPFAPMLAVLAMEPGTMVSPTAVKKMGDDFARHPVGTGPFKFVSWSSGRVELKKFEKYWKKGVDNKALPYLDKVVIRAIPKTAVKIVELKSGNIHVADSIKVQDFNQVKKSSVLDLVPSHRAVNMRLFYNLRVAPFDNLELRKAFSHAINRVALEKIITKGYGEAKTCFEPPTSWAYDKDLKGHDFDTDKAKASLKKSGFKGEVELIIIQRDPDSQIAQVVQAMLKDVGISLKISAIERSAFISKILSGDFDLMMGRAGLPRPDPHIEMFNNLHSSGSRNYGGVKDDLMDKLLDKAAESTDIDERKELYIQIQQRDLDNYYMIHLFNAPMTDVVSKSVQGFGREYSGSWFCTNIWLKQ